MATTTAKKKPATRTSAKAKTTSARAKTTAKAKTTVKPKTTAKAKSQASAKSPAAKSKATRKPVAQHTTRKTVSSKTRVVTPVKKLTVLGVELPSVELPSVEDVRQELTGRLELVQDAVVDLRERAQGRVEVAVANVRERVGR